MNKGVDIARVQNVLFDMARRIASVLEEHKIPYMIAFGTLLGAVRHQDLIPWDDDFDFYLFEDRYEEALSVLRKELPSFMFVEDEKSEPLYFHSWAHVKDLNSEAYCELFPQDSTYSHKGISIDLYKTHPLKLSALDDYLDEENRKYLERRISKGLIDKEEYEQRMERLIHRNMVYPTGSDETVYNLVPLYKCHYMKEKSVFPLKKYTIRGCEFWGPNDADDILSGIYGDYMKLPPLEKRTCHYSKVIFY